MKLILQKLLKILAKRILRRHKPKIIGITGSVGKSSTKEAVALVLAKKFRVQKSFGNYNNEIGVPLSIIGERSPGKNVFGWIKILFKGFLISRSVKNYPEILVLEMGIDRPGDMDYLVDLAKPDVAIITAISEIPVHLEFFKSREHLAQEKGKIIKCLSKNDSAILNFDDKEVRKLKPITKANILSFGLNEKSDFWADNIALGSREIYRENESMPKGVSFRLHARDTILPFRLPHIFGFQLLYAVLSAVACARALGMNLVDIAQAIAEFRPPKGRMNLISGIKQTNIIDDSYNASPQSTLAALKVLGSLVSEGKKVAILGDMLELGPMTEHGHREVGREAVKVCNVLITVGEAARFIADEARRSGMARTSVFEFWRGDAVRAARFVQEKILKKGDLVLIKGSQGMRLEKAVRELMAEPARAHELLVRQGREWV